MRRGIVALAVVFLAAHLPFLPPTLEDIDSVNFALGVQHFDVARHQPHPPGYPVFIAMSKASTYLLRTAGVAAPEARGLAIWSAIGGALMILFAGAFFGAVAGDRRVALLTALLMACAPLFWFTALRPLSDMIGLAAAFAALATMAAAIPLGASTAPDLKAGSTDATFDGRSRARRLIAGAWLAGLAIGIRSQTFVMTLPLLAYIVFAPRRAFPARTRALSIIAAVLGVGVWMVPLVIASGGPGAYLNALGSQGAEDFSGVVMLWTHRTLRVAAYALLNTFVLPWDSLVLAAIVVVLAAVGAILVLWRSPRVGLILGLVFVPYAAFHLLFHEVVTVRYALPLVPAVAFLAVTALLPIHRYAAAVGVAALVAYGVALAVPASTGFARQPSPIFRLLADMNAAAQGGISPVIAMHRRELTETRRPREWSGGVPGRLLPAPRDYEWLEVTRTWREGSTSPVWFIADPRRTDLALIDARDSRTTEYRWPFTSAVYVGGARPDEMDWHVYAQPGWFLEQGWALTAEVAGVTTRDGWGPQNKPSVGWIRTRPGEALMMIGGRHLGAAGDPRVKVTLALAGRPLDEFEAAPGFFFRLVPLPPSSLAGAPGYVPLEVRSKPADGSARTIAVGLEQFDLQPDGVPMAGVEDGWQEPEYNPLTARAWRWTTERATLWVRPIGRDVTLRLVGESPLRYYDRAPVVVVTAGDREVARFSPASDFTQEIVLPADALAAAAGRVVIASDKWFVPGERGGPPDRRHLALRIYSFDVR